MKHFALDYSKRVNEILHSYLYSTWFYKHQIYEIPGLCTALLITYTDQKEDEFEIHPSTDWDGFLKRMSIIKSDWASFSRVNIQRLAKQPKKVIGGWEGRTIYFIKGGSNPEFWTVEWAEKDAIILIDSCAQIHGQLIKEEARRIDEIIPVGHEHYRDYEHFVRVVINYLFISHLGEAKPQVRTELGNEAIEIRDLICQNRSNYGFWKDLKEKYSCSEIIFDAKNKKEITRDDLRQIYCYLKPAIGLWGFIICRAKQLKTIDGYNRTLFKNFAQSRGVLILSVDDLRRMISIRLHGKEPSEYLHDRMSEYIRGI